MKLKKITVFFVISVMIFSCTSCTITIGKTPELSDSKKDKDEKKEEQAEASSKNDDKKDDATTPSNSSEDKQFEAEKFIIELADGWSYDSKLKSTLGVTVTNTKSTIKISSSLNDAKNLSYIYSTKKVKYKNFEPEETTIDGKKTYCCKNKEDKNSVVLFLDSEFEHNCIIYEIENGSLDDEPVLNQIKKVKAKQIKKERFPTIEGKTIKNDYYTINLCNDWSYDLDETSIYSAEIVYPKERLRMSLLSLHYDTLDEAVQNHEEKKEKYESEKKEITIGNRKCYYYINKHTGITLFMETEENIYDISLFAVNDDLSITNKNIQEQIKNIK